MLLCPFSYFWLEMSAGCFCISCTTNSFCRWNMHGSTHPLKFCHVSTASARPSVHGDDKVRWTVRCHFCSGQKKLFMHAPGWISFHELNYYNWFWIIFFFFSALLLLQCMMYERCNVTYIVWRSFNSIWCSCWCFSLLSGAVMVSLEFSDFPSH